MVWYTVCLGEEFGPERSELSGTYTPLLLHSFHQGYPSSSEMRNAEIVTGTVQPVVPT
jgi:hypothetical protein